MSMFLKKKTQKFTYDATVHGGTKATSIGLGWLPKDALIVGGCAVVTTAFADADAGGDTTVALGYTSATTAFFPATACTVLIDNIVLKLIPGVINIVDSALITTIDTPAEVVSASRASGDTYSMIKLTDTKEVLITISNHQNITAGKMDIYIDYIQCDA